MSECNPNPASAVALKYNPNKDNAPIVVAAGNGYIAQQIIELATKNKVPVYQDNGASALLSQLQIGSQIPPELYTVVAEIYSYILNINHQSKIESEFQSMNPDQFEKVD